MSWSLKANSKKTWLQEKDIGNINIKCYKKYFYQILKHIPDYNYYVI